MNLWIVFLTGLTIGGLTCLAVQGGLLASVIAAHEENLPSKSKGHSFFVTVVFLVSKLIAYMILGFILGAFGETISIGGSLQSIMQILAGVYMVAVALNLLDVHPIFRYVIIQPPRFLTKLVKKESKSKDIFAPAILGAMTIFIPCGTTLGMEALALSSASAITGALIMGAFVLGTTPLFLGIGFITSILGETFRSKFLKLAAVAVIYLGLSSINGGLTALGSPVTFQSVSQDLQIVFLPKSNLNQIIATNQNPEIIIDARGYSPNVIRVKKGLPVNLKLISKDAFSCASAFRIPSLGISKNLKPNDTQTITFTPEKEGKIAFSCAMGMYTGTIEVI